MTDIQLGCSSSWITYVVFQIHCVIISRAKDFAVVANNPDVMNGRDVIVQGRSRASLVPNLKR
ncbi:hypothetical protein DPMN_020643 [Dreissena polymorpha]|uniref:Uncharacterized protein n=1 Tax=Dreissena polymorpha TaxID=45954 RepID=A0A9D4NKM9_DREPO|nr:hypothetical protein DPMN_020643 [Dreissena polymorpha]